MQSSTTVKIVYAARHVCAKNTRAPKLGSLILPDSFEVEITPALGAAHAPPLTLVPGAKCHGAAAAGDIQAAAALIFGCIAPIYSVRGGLELSNSLGLEGGLLGIWRVGDGLQTGNARAA